MTDLTASLENYLEAILEIEKEQKEVKAGKIAEKLSVSKASVTEAIRALGSKGFLNYAPYSKITLTEEGRVRAEKIAVKHEVLYDFLINILKIEKQEAIETACKIEHVISEKILERLIIFLEFNKTHCAKNHGCNQLYEIFKD